MNILAIDLGHTTGICLLRDEALFAHGTVPLEAVAEQLSGLNVDLVVIERPAYREHPTMQERYEMTIGRLRILFGTAKVKIVRPADWMPRFAHHPLPERGVLPTRHEKDAYRMARWAQEKYA